MNQNLTLLFVLRKTLRIMIDTNRYNRAEIHRKDERNKYYCLLRIVTQMQQ